MNRKNDQEGWMPQEMDESGRKGGREGERSKGWRRTIKDGRKKKDKIVGHKI